MNVLETKLDGLIIFEPKVFSDERGFFLETWSRERYQQAGVKEHFVQDNISCSCMGTLRGLHFQNPCGQGKLVQVIKGSVLDVAVDIRLGSKTFGMWESVELTEKNHKQMYVPPGFAHGFCVTSDTAVFSYKCTDYYNPDAEGGIIWNDPEINIDWPVRNPVLSAKDTQYTCLSDIPEEKLPKKGI